MAARMTSNETGEPDQAPPFANHPRSYRYGTGASVVPYFELMTPIKLFAMIF